MSPPTIDRGSAPGQMLCVENEHRFIHVVSINGKRLFNAEGAENRILSQILTLTVGFEIRATSVKRRVCHNRTILYRQRTRLDRLSPQQDLRLQPVVG